MIRTALTAWLVLLTITCGYAEENQTTRRILYLARQGNTVEAIDLYRNYTEAIGKADYELLQLIGLHLLELGFASKEPETQLLAVYGAGVAAHDQAASLLSEGLRSRTPEIQLVSLDLLARLGNDEADSLINRAASSEQLLIRLSAIHYLALKKHPLAIGQIEALYHKVVPDLRRIFPQFFALSGDQRAIKQLRRLLHDPDDAVRLQTILSIGEQKRDDLLPQIRMGLTHPNALEQEACASVIGKMDDQTSIPRLRKLTDHKIPEVRLAACQALYLLGQHDVRPGVEELASAGNLFAIVLLGGMEGGENTLASLVQSPNIHIRCNATLALLARRDLRCLPGLVDILIHDARDLGFTQVTSRGQTLSACKVVPSAQHAFADTPVALELSTALREKTLRASLELPQEAFLAIADGIFERQQNDLIPATVELLENAGTSKAIALLKKHQQKAGAPLVRNYCTLALYKLGEPGPYGEKLRQWLLEQQRVDMISFRPFVPMELRDPASSYSLTPKEASRLFIASVEALGNQHDEAGLQVLLDLIRDGNPKNRCVLAGLLMRATQ